MVEAQPSTSQSSSTMERASCFFGLGSSPLGYRSKTLTPLSGTPLVVFDGCFLTQRKLELILKVESVPDDYVVKSVTGEHWFTIERKDAGCWDERLIRSAAGDPICCIRKNKYPQVEGFSIVSLVKDEEDPVINLHTKSSKSKTLQKMRAILAMGDNIGTRNVLKVCGDLTKRMYGVSWPEAGKKAGPMIAMTWDVCSEGRTNDRGCARYVLEIPAGVDAACMVSIATAICERDAPGLDCAVLPLEPQYNDEINLFGCEFVAKTQMSLVMAAKDDRLNIIDGEGCIRLSMDALGVCKAPNGRDVFQLSDDGMSVQGVVNGSDFVEVSFSKLGPEGSPQHLLALITSDVDPNGQTVLVSPTQCSGQDVVLPIRRVLYMDEQSDAVVMDGPVIARVLLKTAGSSCFDTWFYNAKSRVPSSALSNSPPELGTGADISSGVDIAVIAAVMLMMIKLSPVAKRMRAILGRIRAFDIPVPPRGYSRNSRSSSFHDTIQKKYNDKDLSDIMSKISGVL